MWSQNIRIHQNWWSKSPRLIVATATISAFGKPEMRDHTTGRTAFSDRKPLLTRETNEEIDTALAADMSQGYELLVAEADRVLNSAYPTQLKVGTTSRLLAIYLQDMAILTCFSNFTSSFARNVPMPMFSNGQLPGIARSMRSRDVSCKRCSSGRTCWRSSARFASL